MKLLKSGQYYGDRRQQVDVASIKLSEYDYSVPSTDWHYHENPYFMFVLRGNIHEINQKSKTPCPPGSLIFHNWQELHRNSKETGPARGFHLELGQGWGKQIGFDLEQWRGSQVLKNPNCHLLLSQIYFEFRQIDNYSALSIELLLSKLIESVGNTAPANQRLPSWIDRLVELVNDAPDDLSLHSLSNTLGVHPVHLSRAVPKYFGESLGSYIRKQKLKKSVGYLLYSKYSLSEIAHVCGFSDQSHFIRVFRNYFKCTPGKLRKKVG